MARQAQQARLENMGMCGPHGPGNVDMEEVLSTLKEKDPGGLYTMVQRVEDRPTTDPYPLVPDVIVGVVSSLTR